MKNRNTAFVKHILSLLFFGSNGVVASNIPLSSYHIVLARTFLGSIFLLLLFLLSKGRFSVKKHPKDLLFIAISGMAMGASWMFLYEGFSQIGVSITTLLYYCGPVFVMVLSPVLFGEKLTLFKVLGFAGVLAGVILINGTRLESINVWGFSCAMLSAVTYAVMVISNKKSKHIVGMENSVIQLCVSFVTVLIFVSIKSGLNIQIPTESIPYILILGVLNTGFGCYLYFSSIGSLSAQTVSVCGCLESLCAVVLSMIFLKETMSIPQIIGAVLIISGATVGECVKKREKTADTKNEAIT